MRLSVRFVASLLSLAVTLPAAGAEAQATSRCPAVASRKTDLAALAMRDTASLKPSGWGEPAASVVFVNATCVGVQIQWRDYYGRYHTYATLAAGDSTSLSTYVTHHWVARVTRGAPLALFVVPAGGGRAVVRAAAAAPAGRRS